MGEKSCDEDSDGAHRKVRLTQLGTGSPRSLSTSTGDIEDELVVHKWFGKASSGSANEPERQIIDYDTLRLIQPTCDLQDCIQDILDDNMYFRGKLAEVTKNIDVLERQNHELKSQLRVGEPHPADHVETLCDELVDLRRRLNVRVDILDPCLKSKTEDHRLLKKMIQMKKQIESSFYQMGRLLEFLSSGEEFRYPQTDHLKQESTEDLGELLARVFVDVQELSHLHSQVSAGDLVQAIVGTAVCEWVFESDLRCMAMMKTPLLEALKCHMSTIGGEAAFQNLYFAAHHLVVRDDHFKTVYVPRTATKLATRLLGALGPFIMTKRNTISIGRDLEAMFQQALEIKTQVVVGKYMFRTIWPGRGSAYKKRLMKKLAGVPGHGLKVKLPLVPGLLIYSREKMSVDYCSFTKGDESVWGKPEVFCKAVVAIEI